MKNDGFDIIVVGAGHAGCEAALAASRMGLKTAMITFNVDHVAAMSCNPAVGGLGKSHLVREIDALGGQMGVNTDATGIQFRRLNTRKGPAVRALRVQSDMDRYCRRMRQVVEAETNLTLIQDEVEAIIVQNGKAEGVRCVLRGDTPARSVILTTGTFLGGLIHVGLNNFPAGRMGDPASIKLSRCLRSLGFEIGRLKTGTTPRLNGTTIDYQVMTVQPGDDDPRPFSILTDGLPLPQRPCHLTRTTKATHDVIRGGLDRSPLYSGKITGVGARYCPSIEDKVVRFAQKQSHQVFIEPEGLDTTEVYPNGIPTSLPIDVQRRMIASIPGLEKTEIVRPGYAIEYDFVQPTELTPWLMTKRVSGLFFAGQINGTSGYEEAAAQGLWAGVNAALFIRNEEPVTLGRDQAYLGVMIDDLATKGTNEPYRMFTSRAEYRLLLREDNAAARLTPLGRKLGLVGDEQWRRFIARQKAADELRDRLAGVVVRPSDLTNDLLNDLGSSPIREPVKLYDLVRRPELKLADLTPLDEGLARVPPLVAEQVEVEIKYEGYLKRQKEQAERMGQMENRPIPQNVDYASLPGLSFEVAEKLGRVQPRTFGQAARISGVTPASLTVLAVHLKRRSKN